MVMTAMASNQPGQSNGLTNRGGQQQGSRQAGQQPQPVSATYMKEQDVQDFVYQYSQLQNQARQVEAEAKDLSLIAAVNFQLAERLQGFLRAARQTPRVSGNAPQAVLISLDELRMLETESQLRLLRAEAVQQAQTLNLGNVLINSLDQTKLQADINREVERLNSSSGGSGSGGDSGDNDESSEEKNPQSVNLEKSDGLYTLLDPSAGLGISDLIGYQQEATILLNLTKSVHFVGRGLDELNDTGKNNRPVSIILYGPPGTGKTTSAQAVAKTLGYTYMYVNAESVISMWAGGTQKNIVKIFRRARIATKVYGRKCLILIDEIDGLLKNRQSGGAITGEEYSRITTFLQMLTPPTGIDNSQLVCMFTTNNLENLDPAFVNRMRQSIFLGYIVNPNDRAKLFAQMLHPYIQEHENNWWLMANNCPEYVPRDIVNLVSLVRAAIVEKWQQQQQQQQQKQQLGGLQSGNVVVPLDNPTVLLTTEEMILLTQRMSPATPVDSYFNYNPPVQHIRSWLEMNSIDGIRLNVLQAFEQHYRSIANGR